MENGIDLTPDMLLGLPIEAARGAASAVGYDVRIYPPDTAWGQDPTPGCFSLIVSDTGTVLEAWGYGDGANSRPGAERIWPEPYFSSARYASGW